MAMKEIERIKGEKVWQKGQPKEYYTELTDTLRTYIKGRFGFNALEIGGSFGSTFTLRMIGLLSQIRMIR